MTVPVGHPLTLPTASFQQIVTARCDQRSAFLDWRFAFAGVTESAVLRRVVRDGTHPDDQHAEHFFVAAPAGVGFKKHAGFERRWHATTHTRRRTEGHLIAA